MLKVGRYQPQKIQSSHLKLRVIVMCTDLEYRERERQRKRESRRQASEAQREKEREIKDKGEIFFLEEQHENFLAAVGK